MLSTGDKVSRKVVMLTFIPVYGHAVLWCVAPLLGWGKYGPESSGISCALMWAQLPLSYTVSIFTSLFLIPVTTMLFCYTSIIRQVHIAQKGAQMVRNRMDIYMLRVSGFQVYSIFGTGKTKIKLILS